MCLDDADRVKWIMWHWSASRWAIDRIKGSKDDGAFDICQNGSDVSALVVEDEKKNSGCPYTRLAEVPFPSHAIFFVCSLQGNH